MLIQKTRKSLSFLYSDLHCYAHRKSTVFFSCHISRIHLCKMKDSRVVPVGVHCASLRSEHEEGVLAMYAYSVTSTLRAEKPSQPAYVTFVLRDPLYNGSEALQAAVHEWKRITVDGKGDASFISFSTLSMCVIGVLSKQGGLSVMVASNVVWLQSHVSMRMVAFIMKVSGTTHHHQNLQVQPLSH
jgi:hypothetical protein